MEKNILIYFVSIILEQSDLLLFLNNNRIINLYIINYRETYFYIYFLDNLGIK